MSLPPNSPADKRWETFSRAPQWAAFRKRLLELVALKPGVIVTAGTPSAFAAKQASSTIPIVALGVADPVGLGLVASLARSEGNVTGNTNIGTDIAGKWLELVRADEVIQ